MPRLGVATVCLVLLVIHSGCNNYVDNLQSCARPENIGKPGCPTTGGPCQSDNDCKVANLGICDTTLEGGTCVRCTEAKHAACTNPTPACINDTCRECTQHTQCASKVCLSDG